MNIRWPFASSRSIKTTYPASAVLQVPSEVFIRDSRGHDCRRRGFETDLFVLGNLMSNWQDGIRINPAQRATGDLRGNGTLAVTTPYLGGTNILNGGVNY